jgi:dienelactone hydrolase
MNRRSFIQTTAAATGAIGAAPLLAADKAKTVNDDLAASMPGAKLSMLFRGKTASEFKTWEKAFRAKLNSLLGDSTPPEKWDVVVEETTELDDHTRHALLLKAHGVASLPVYLLVPKGLLKGAEAPGILCVHGHGKYGNDPIVGRRDLPGVAEDIDKMNYDYGRQFVRCGYVVVAPCMVPFGRRVDRKAYGGKDPCAVTFVRMQALGKLSITENLRDLRWALSFLQANNSVDPERLGCAGLSYGGRMTMMATAIDRRIKVASVSGALNLLQERMTLRHSCGSQMIPSLLNFGDYSEIGSLIAPRPCVWETGSKDGLIVPKWDEIFRDRLRRAYTAAGVEKNLHFDRFEGGHKWSGRIAFPLFDKILKG